MSRLYEASVDENLWKLIEISNDCYHSYKLIDKKTEDVYTFRNIIGIEQVDNNEFLVHKRVNYNDFEIKRYKLENTEYIVIFKETFNHLDFITNDKILLRYTDRSANYRSKGIYSINENDYLEEGNWLNSERIDIYKDEETSENKLLVEMDLPSYHLGDQLLMFTVDPDTLEPNSLCYSSLRDSFIEVNTKENIYNLKREDRRYISIIEDYIYRQNSECKNKAKEKILKK